MSKRKTDEEFRREVFNLVSDEYTILGKYINNHTKIRAHHKKCNKEIEITPKDFLKGVRCRNCYMSKAGHHRRKTPERFEEEVKELFGEEYSVVEPYVNSRTKVGIRHNMCGSEYMANPRNILKGSTCLECSYKNRAEKLKKSQGDWDKFVYEETRGEYLFIEEYVNDSTKIKVWHEVCGLHYKARPNDFINGYRCPNCIESKGESKTRIILEKYNVKFEREYKMNDCRHIHALPFDFAIDVNGSLLLIEYDGEQHFSNIFGEESFRNTIRNDKIKNEYCEKKGIPLLRIPYYKYDDMEKIIKDYLNIGEV